MNIADNIKKLRKSHGYTQKDLANILQVKPTAISAWESGRNKPLMDKVTIMATLFGVSTSDIVGDTFNKNDSILSLINETSSQLSPPRKQKVYDFAESQLKEQKQEIKQKNNSITSLEQFRKKKEEEIIYGTIKWCGCVSAGTGEFLTDETCEEIELPIEQIPTEADFCLSVNGDSMEPTFHNGEYVFVKKQLDIFSGKIGVAIFNGEAFLKRIWFENGEARLESLNKKYKDIIITENDEFRIVGKVVM
ncbi:helix-turn-helix domain-containing protein [Enterococcus faecalis]|uniref:helix-turn-helix domain-containing protein n=1 Tax=Enterococcus faecalis TaxID=1351 RepID=UPI001F490920|nr:S24 family peptidase [Enterococcus faecalis]BDC76548.1 helix-turn-helix transcriptional regulator [Enterococcus faecalis]